MILTSLRRKLILAYLGLIAACLALAGWLLLGRLPAWLVDSAGRDLVVRAAMARELVHLRWPAAPPSPEDGDRLAMEVKSFASAAGVTLIALDGSVLGDSHRPSPGRPNQADRPEVQAALAGRVGLSRRHSETTGEPVLYAAVPAPAHGPRPAMVVRLSVSLAWVYERIAAVRAGLGWGLGAALAVAVLAGLWSGQVLLAGPLAKVVSGARRFARGELDQPVEVRTGDDWEDLAGSLNEMAAALSKRIADLSEGRAQVSRILEGLPDGVLLLSPQLALRSANRQARDWLRLPPSGSTGPPGLGRSPELLQFARQAATAPGPLLGEATLRGPVSVKLELRSSWLGAPGHSDLLLVMQDITLVRRLESARRDLVANVSHELKTPIGAIRALAEALAADPQEEPPVRADFLARIVSESERLSKLVEEMLYLSRVESDAGGLQIRPSDLGEIAHLAAASVMPLARAKDIRIEVDQQGQTGLACDPDLVERAVRALLDNAVKFSPPGRPVTVRVVAQEEGVELTVRDRGPGIRPEVLERVFERFYKGDESRSSAGSGLGLAIVKHVVGRHAGRLIAHSAEGGGSTFGFALPRSRAGAGAGG